MNFLQQMAFGDNAYKRHQEQELKRRQLEEDRRYELEMREREREKYERAKKLLPLEEEKYKREHAKNMREMDRAEAGQRMSDYMRPYQPSRGFNEKNQRVLDANIPVSPAVFAAATGLGAGISPEMLEDSLDNPIQPFNRATIENYRTPEDIEAERDLAIYKEKQDALLARQKALDTVRAKARLLVEKERNKRAKNPRSSETSSPESDPFYSQKVKRFNELEKAWQAQKIQEFMEKEKRSPSKEEYKKIVEEAREMAATGSGVNPFEIPTEEGLSLAPEEDFETLYSEEEYLAPYNQTPEWLLPKWLKSMPGLEGLSPRQTLRDRLRSLEQRVGSQLEADIQKKKEELERTIRGNKQEQSPSTVEPYSPGIHKSPKYY
jgi:hypothetical protein